MHAYIEVNELDRGIEFYCDGLGLRLKRRLSPSWVELEGANLPVIVGEPEGLAGARVMVLVDPRETSGDRVGNTKILVLGVDANIGERICP